MPERKKRHVSVLRYSLLGIACVAPPACTDLDTTHLDRIKRRGEIVVVTRNGPNSYYIEKNDAAGLEYELAKKFADYLGVGLKLVIAKNTAEITDVLSAGKADFAAAALISNQTGNGPLIYGPSYYNVTQQLAYRNGNTMPTSLADLQPARLDLAADTAAVLPLDQMRRAHPDLALRLHDDQDSHEMLELLENREIRYTITDAYELILAQQYYPEIRAAFDVTAPQPVAWAFRRSGDASLLNAAWKFHGQIANNGELPELLSRFFSPRDEFDYMDARKFVDRFQTRLPPYRSLFEAIAGEHGLDWRLLAAISYQESHWDEAAKSKTGVQGLMMLTQDTAKSLGVNDRLDPEQSVRGGAQYLKTLLEKIPARIAEPDRTWLAVAAYNVGFGHLEDARVLTQRQGGDPDNWLEVKRHLPLLSRKQWHKQTKFGFARGVETNFFVENVNRYYNTLVQLTQPVVPPDQQAARLLVETPLIDDPVLW
jgi:membrane-bound lytic murein transglycosylase F